MPRQVGVGPRGVAAVIDFIVSLLVIGLPLAVVLGEKSTVSDSGGTTSYWTMNNDLFLLWVLLTLVYFVVFETLFGATIGQAHLGPPRQKQRWRPDQSLGRASAEPATDR